MLYTLQIILMVLAGIALFGFISKAFAFELSRAMEAALDSIEYRFALNERRRTANVQTSACSGDAGYSMQVEVS